MKFILIVLCCIAQAVYSGKKNIDSPRIEPRILGGEVESPEGGNVPSVCSLQVSRRHKCGCSIISERWIVTAAHCVFGKSTLGMEILTGTTNIKNKFGKYYQAEHFVIHEDYKPNSMKRAGDIAVLRIIGKFDLNERVQPIELSPDVVPHSAQAKFMGWGKTTMDETVASEQLQKIQTTILGLGNCQKTPMRSMVWDHHICALSRKGVGACDGDSGGPLIYANKLVGVANFVRPCATGVPDVFASIAHYYNWIKKKTT